MKPITYYAQSQNTEYIMKTNTYRAWNHGIEYSMEQSWVSYQFLK